MVGVILASHGGFADGIHQSAEMIFGPQENFKSCILKPDEGPEDVKKKMQEAIASLDNQDEVLFLYMRKHAPRRQSFHGILLLGQLNLDNHPLIGRNQILF